MVERGVGLVKKKRRIAFSVFFFNDTATTEIYTLSLHDALPIYVFCYMRDGDKQITKKIELEDGKILEATITYREPKGSYAKVLHPTLHLQLWEPANTPGMMCKIGRAHV